MLRQAEIHVSTELPKRRRSTRRAAIAADEIFAGQSQMGPLIRDFDWARTPLGPIDSWSPAGYIHVRTTSEGRYRGTAFSVVLPIEPVAAETAQPAA